MSTYTPISTQTLTADAATVTFTGIPQTYTDIVLVCNFGTSSSGRTGTMRFNGDTGTNYSWRSIGGNGTSAQASGGSNISSIYFTGQITGDGTALANVAVTSIQNYSNTTTYKTVISRSNDAARYVELAVGTWRSTAAINRIDLARDNGTNWLSGSSFTLYGIGAGSPKAFGGDTVTTDGTYWYHTFRSSGVFAPMTALTNVDFLVIGGGGGGAGGANGANTGGGGGAGGLRSTVTATGGGGSLESKLSLTGGTNYAVTVGAGGAGGAGGSTSEGVVGSDSVFSTITSKGGGKSPGGTGGSGGGGKYSPTTAGLGTANQGFNGGAGNPNSPYLSGGGGGAGAVGANGTAGGAGGNGVATSITGSSVTYAGGGGAGSSASGGAAASGGTGGGGNGGAANTVGSNGTANLGGGGGGGAETGSTAGGSGGSGLVIVRYAV
jgi:hypothetical protein